MIAELEQAIKTFENCKLELMFNDVSSLGDGLRSTGEHPNKTWWVSTNYLTEHAMEPPRPLVKGFKIEELPAPVFIKVVKLVWEEIDNVILGQLK